MNFYEPLKLLLILQHFSSNVTANIHRDNDDTHLDKLYGMLDRTCTSMERADAIVRTAKVVGRLYALQLEELDLPVGARRRLDVAQLAANRVHHALGCEDARQIVQ